MSWQREWVLPYTGQAVPSLGGMKVSWPLRSRNQRSATVCPTCEKLLTFARGLVWKQVLIFRMWLFLITRPSSHLHVSWNVFQSRGLDGICHHCLAAQADHSDILACLSGPERSILFRLLRSHPNCHTGPSPSMTWSPQQEIILKPRKINTRPISPCFVVERYGIYVWGT